MKFITEIEIAPHLPEQIVGHIEMQIYGAVREATMQVLHGALHSALMMTAERYASDPSRETGTLVSVHTVLEPELVTP